jgi:hypothetical protein
MPESQGLEEPYAWLAWLGEKDAAVLLLSLMQAIEGGSTEATLRGMVAGWRRNALRALTDDQWTAQIDGYLEVRVDARLVALTRPQEEEESDA